ncbi:hypothetical protein X777_16376 [Ooceraea biroi]|uniref:Uncharacterized protein n=1 Tax=Ooceraea biroi TaxID=2015173 RepID=A0A026WUN7_OOCBI|nr:hypothetical protein X777_16376 [Ooceraea biroi]
MENNKKVYARKKALNTVLDARRVEIAERSMTDAAKEARTTAISQRKEAEETDVTLEGQLYGAGIAE